MRTGLDKGRTDASGKEDPDDLLKVCFVTQNILYSRITWINETTSMTARFLCPSLPMNSR